MDRAFGTIINGAFYFFLACVTLAALGVNPLVLFASVSSFFVGFAFMIGAACSNYFEGLLFILVRRPYDIGDRINVSSVTVDTSTTGSPGWIVKDVDLFTTTVVFGSVRILVLFSCSQKSAILDSISFSRPMKLQLTLTARWRHAE
jgi:small-conductance mechanosensitive channel